MSAEVQAPVRHRSAVREQMELLFDDGMPDMDVYTVRVSNRARSVSLRVVPLQGLEVTIPRRFPRRQVPAVIAENREWISQQMQRVLQETDPEFLDWPPRVLRLRAIDQVVVVHCEPAVGSGVSARWDAGALLVNGKLTDRLAVLHVLAAALKQRAREVLLPQLHALAAEHQLSFKRCAVRGQKTVWGSYSSSGTLSLNYKLLFLEPELVRYVLLHELAHIRFLDHSKQFWAFLCSMEPDAKSLDRALNEAGKLVPPWLEAL